MKAISIGKFEEGLINEDTVIAKDCLIAVSDGAGGGGLFADCWSRYLVEHLPDEPITDYQAFDKWLDGIWEPFYNECEVKAQKEGGMLLNKFYDEGSFATIAVAWKSGEWVSYGDSVVFCYDKETGNLQHSFTKLVDFNNPPYLINCKDPTDEKGFRYGHFNISRESVVFVTSDALAHYILMMYEVTHKDEFGQELQEGIDAKTKNSNFIKTAMSLNKLDFEKEVLDKLMNGNNTVNFFRHLQCLRKKELIGHDDYSIAVL